MLADALAFVVMVRGRLVRLSTRRDLTHADTRSNDSTERPRDDPIWVRASGLWLAAVTGAFALIGFYTGHGFVRPRFTIVVAIILMMGPWDPGPGDIRAR